MSVICKVYVSSIKPVGSTSLVFTNCVAENEVMAAYSPDHEDKLFSQYSPSGSAEFVVPDWMALQLPQGLGLYQDKLYLMFVQSDTAPKFSKALGYSPMQVRSMTDYGGTSKQFDMCTVWGTKAGDDARMLTQFAHRIMIDNPKASKQFVPGAKDWWVGIYDASKHTFDDVVSDAHAA